MNLEPVLGGDDTTRRNFSKLEDLFTGLARLTAAVFGGGTETGGTPEANRYVGDTGQPAFTNSWVNNDAGTIPPSGVERAAFFYKDRDRVYLGGVIKTGTSGTSAFTLPAGYRPRATVGPAVNASGADAVVLITTAGLVTPTNVGASAVATFVALDGVDFRIA